jgi:acetoacetyl-CoA synthetase
MSEPAPTLWEPSPEEIEARNLTAFAEQVKRNLGLDFGRDYDALWRWSVSDKGAFWREAWQFLGIVSEGPLEPALLNGESFTDAKWFPEVRLNYAETILKWPDDQVALAAVNESGDHYQLTFADLRAGASRAQQAFVEVGVVPGTRIGAILLNTPDAIMAMLGATSLGGVWTSVSPDFGAPGMLDRLSQAEPEILLAADGYTFAGRHYDVRDKIAEVAAALPSVRKVIVVGADGAPDVADMDGVQSWDDFLASYAPKPMVYTRLPFDHPLFILYTSGTTGVPKCIVHSAGGSMLKSVGEHAMLFDLKPGDTAFFPTTLGWMMWNFLVNYLGTGAKIVCYDGSPFYPDTGRLWQLAAEEGVTVLGLGSSYIEACRKNGVRPTADADLSAVRMILAGGSVLSPEGFDYIYENFTGGVQLSSATGGTEIMGCLVGANPWGGVRRGELQAPALGLDVAVLDADRQTVHGEKGELVCRSPFPSLPLGLLGDADGTRFHETYFSQNPGMWTQGDFAEAVADSGGYIVYGRSDATLNPGGVRIGTAEIYRQVDRIGEVLESIVVGQKWQNDVRVVLFVRLQEGAELNDALEDKIRATVRAGASPRHVPRKILAVPDIPKTRTGKIAEIAVRDVVNGEVVRNREALANANALDAFADRPELRD